MAQATSEIVKVERGFGGKKRRRQQPGRPHVPGPYRFPPRMATSRWCRVMASRL